VQSRVSDERRLFRAATFVCAWPPLEEVEYFGWPTGSKSRSSWSYGEEKWSG